MPVAVSNLQRRRVSARRLAAVARRALAALGRADHEIHVTVVDDRRIRALNARYLGHRRATDVLAFDLAGPGRLWGEVIVSAGALNSPVPVAFSAMPLTSAVRRSVHWLQYSATLSNPTVYLLM